MNDRPVSSGTRIRLFRGTALLVVIAIAAIITVVLLTREKDFVVEGGYQVIGDAVSKQVLAGESSTLSHDDGARIEVPQGAISNPATLVIVEVEPPVSTLAVPFAYDFSVAGATLLNPVTVHIPIEPGWADQPSNIHALHWSDEFEDWEPVAGIVDESLQTIAVTTDDLSLFTAVFVEVEATCDVDPTTAQTGRYGQSITFSSTVRAIETPLNSNINVYMRPSFIDYTRGTVSSEVVGDPFRTETRTLTEGGSSVTFSYSSKTDYSGKHDFKCRLFWEFPGDIPDNELEPDSVVTVAFDVTGTGTYFGYVSYDGSRLKSCGPSSTPLPGESVPIKVKGHGVDGDVGYKTYFVAAVKIYEDSELIHLEFGKRPTDSFTNAIPIVDTTYTFPSDGHYTMDCELWWHAGDPYIPTGTLKEKAKSIGRCVYSSSFCVGGAKALRGVLTRTFDITRARWAAGGVRVSPSILPNEGGDITVTVHSESSTGVQIAAPTISVDALGLRLPTLSCGTTDLGGYVSRCWQASFNGANTIPANNSSQGVTYQVTASSVSVPGGGQAASVTVGAPPPPPIVQPPPPTDASDREALIALYDATRGEDWNNNSNGFEVWDVRNPDPDIGSWHGVTVNDAGRVTELYPSSNGLEYYSRFPDSIPVELGNLSFLEWLDLSSNDLRGRIPEALGNLRNLLDLDLSDNSLSGNIPASLGSLTNLEALYLSDNDLSGEIPVGLGYLPRMDVVYLGGNDLSGCIPAEWRRVQGDLDELGLPYCDVALNDLTINPGRLSPEFEVSESRYTAEVPAYETTITPANYQGASFQFLDAGGNVLTDADAARPGHQVQVTAATTTVTILVTSRDGREDGSYTIGIARSPGAPGAPVMNPATPGPSTLAISWSAPSDTGTSAISSYSLRYRVARSSGGASAPWTVIQSVWNPSLGSLNHDLTGLQPNVRYELQMRAINSSGIGPWSATTTGTTVSALPPGAPLNLTATTPGQAEIRLSWQQPASDGGSSITGYRIQVSQDGSTWATLVPNARPGSLTYSHTALSAGSTWHYRVAAINSSGIGPWSATTTGTTVSALPPGAPLNLTATTPGQAEIRLSWQQPASDGGSSITGYRIQVSQDGSTWATLVPNARPGSLTYSHTALSAGSTWHYRVAAINSAGVGSLSSVATASTVSPVTPKVPGPPVNPAATAEGTTVIRLTWGPPASDGNDAVSGYQLEVSEDGARWTPLDAVGPLTTSYTHTGLSPQSARRYRVAAVNPVGLGEWSVVFSATTDPVTTLPVEPPVSGSPEGDRIALAAFYHATGGRDWERNDNWLTNAPLGEWYRVTTDSEGRVTHLYLPGNELSGEIPAELGDLTNLGVLELSNNQLTGEIPAELGDLTNLGVLELSNNQLTGEIPAELGDLTNLVRLELSFNQLTGEIPAELGDLTNLGWLSLYSNELTGEIPAELGSLPSLGSLSLSKNELTGEIPAELGSLPSLGSLSLYDNQLTGEIPAELGSLTNLAGLYLHNNQLNGEVPAELGDLTNLEVLWLSSNQLTGEIPAELGGLTNLGWLYLSNNQLTGEIPAELGDLTNLVWLELSNNQLNGEIPAELGDLTNLVRLDLSNNQLDGEIPAELGSLPSLGWLDLSNNQLTGEIPAELGSLPSLESLYLSGNQLVGCMPEGLRNIPFNDLAQLGLQFCGS